jgi:hypothetical protein
MNRKTLSSKQFDHLSKLAELPDEAIDTVDIPETPTENWIYAQHGKFYRPVKQLATGELRSPVGRSTADPAAKQSGD